MTLTEFKHKYKCSFHIQKKSEHEYIAVSKAIDRTNDKIVDSIKTTIDIMEVGQWIADSQTQASIKSWNWDDYIERLKRVQLDYFALRASIEEFYPNDLSVDISTTLYN